MLFDLSKHFFLNCSYLSMHDTAAVLLEDGFLRDVFQEFATRDANGNGDVSIGTPTLE